MNETESLSSVIKQLADRKGDIDISLGDLDIDGHVSSVARLPSKKNKVFCITMAGGSAFVLKVSATSRAANEFSVLTESHSLGLDVPEPYAIREELVFMEFINGSNVCDALNSTLHEGYSVRLAEWFSEFHNAFRENDKTLVKSDAILKNFLETGSKIVGVDFEFAHYGNPVEDLGELCAHILDTDPMFTKDKYELCRVFLEAYHNLSEFALSNIAESTAKALETAAKFRLDQGRMLITKAAELRAGNVAWLQDIGH